MILVSMKRAVVALGLVLIAAGSAGAQQASTGPKWQGWLGCWAPAPSTEAVFETPASGMFVCITPTANANVVTFTTIEGGKTIAQQTLDASGAEQPLTADKCTGLQRAKWSSDERRLFLSSSANCEGLRTATSAILSITPSGDWLDIRGVNAAGSENVRVARYRDAGVPSTIPAEIASALRGRGMASENARIATGAQIAANAVIEASRSAEKDVVSAWLLELSPRLSLSAETLKELAKAGVPGTVTDAMVAVSYPGAFQIARADRRDGMSDDVYRGRRVTAVVDRSIDPWLWGASGYGVYGYQPYGNGYGYNPYGYSNGGGYYGGYYNPPIIIVNGGTQATAHGQVVNGRGYTQPAGTPASTGAHSRPSSTANTPPPSSSPSPSSSSGSSSGSSSSGRTAHPKD